MPKQPLAYNRGPRMRPFLQLAREAGVDIDTELEKAGWSVTELGRADLEVEREESVEIFRLIVRLCNDPLLGLRGAERFDPVDADLLGFLVNQTEHALGAMLALEQYGRLIGDHIRSNVKQVNGRVRLQLGLTGGRKQLPETVDYHVGAVHVTLTRLSRGRLQPTEVWLARPAPRRTKAYEDFFGIPVRFAAETSTLGYREADALVPFQGTSPRLKQLLTEQAEVRLNQLTKSRDLVARTRATIEHALGHEDPSLQGAARDLGMSERTLRRRLQAEGTSFRQLLDEIRRLRALAMIRSSDLNVGELAYYCGFSDGAAFARAFKRWTGQVPIQAIKAQRARRDTP